MPTILPTTCPSWCTTPHDLPGDPDQAPTHETRLTPEDSTVVVDLFERHGLWLDFTANVTAEATSAVLFDVAYELLLAGARLAAVEQSQTRGVPVELGTVELTDGVRAAMDALVSGISSTLAGRASSVLR